MTDETTGAAVDGGPVGLTDAEQLAAIETYLKVLDTTAKMLRARVTRDMGRMHVERVGAYLPDGTKLASVGHSDGRKGAKVTDPEAALEWCLANYPGEVETVQAIRPAFLKTIIDASKAELVGNYGVDPRTGEILPFIEVTQGAAYVSVTTTDDGVERMTALAMGFAGMLERAHPAPGGQR